MFSDTGPVMCKLDGVNSQGLFIAVSSSHALTGSGCSIVPSETMGRVIGAASLLTGLFDGLPVFFLVDTEYAGILQSGAEFAVSPFIGVMD